MLSAAVAVQACGEVLAPAHAAANVLRLCRRQRAPATVGCARARQVRLELQAGHSEQGVARVQAALEFAFLAPAELPGARAATSLVIRAKPVVWQAPVVWRKDPVALVQRLFRFCFVLT